MLGYPFGFSAVLSKVSLSSNFEAWSVVLLFSLFNTSTIISSSFIMLIGSLVFFVLYMRR